jgi:hypothetical protein
MSLFQHPHLTRGIVHTPMGAFTVNRGIVDLPEELGEALGWERVSFESEMNAGPEARRDRRAASAFAPRSAAPRSATR